MLCLTLDVLFFLMTLVVVFYFSVAAVSTVFVASQASFAIFVMHTCMLCHFSFLAILCL